MALSVNAVLVDSGSSWTKPSAGHSGHDNTAGDLAWVPDQSYYKRVRVQLTGNAGEKPNIVNWEIYSNQLPFVTDASTEATVNQPMVNDLVTGHIWVRNATTWGTAPPYYTDTGEPWVSTLRANGARTVVELPIYLDWDTAGTTTVQFLVRAFVPGSFGVASAQAIVAVANPDIAKVA